MWRSTLLLLAVAFLAINSSPTPTPAKMPNYHGCLDAPGMSMKWCNFSMPHHERIEALLAELTTQEKIGLLGPTGTLGNDCDDHTAGAPRVGLSQYMWLVETNTGADATCLGENKCSTTFNGPLGMGASFNRTSWWLKGSVIGTELRAYNNIGWYRGGGPKELIGLTGYGPNLNNPRDPRFGRYSELPGEDPLHAGLYATYYLRGMQEEDKNGHPKMISFLKHYTAYSKETGRGHDTYDISMYDFFDTYLPQYEIAFKWGGARGVMCSYNGENGHPSCANDFILKRIMRELWDQPDAFVSTDCGAVSNLRGAPINAPSDAHAAAMAINNGTDLEMGSELVAKNLMEALKMNLTSEAIINEAARRTLVHLFKAGRFDRLEDIEWTKYNADDVASEWHHKIRDEAALQSFVLLKNENNALPLQTGKSIAVVGPMGNHQDLFSDYFGDQICHGGNMDCVTTIAAAITAANKGGKTTMADGVDINSNDTTKMQAALDLAKAADVVVLVLGIDRSIEHEGQDRSQIDLPGMQSEFAKKVYELNKPTILVLSNGGPVAIDEEMSGAHAIVEVFNPGFGAPMLAETLFGMHNRFGKLPYTIYPKNYINEVDFNNYDMSKAPGRTYRYYTGMPLFKFGEGMSYTTFDMKCMHRCEDELCHPSHRPLHFECHIMNTGKMAGDEVIQVYHMAGEGICNYANSRHHPVPIKSLVHFERVSLMPGESKTVEFMLGEEAFKLVNEHGARMIYPGERAIVFSRGTGEDQFIPITI